MNQDDYRRLFKHAFINFPILFFAAAAAATKTSKGNSYLIFIQMSQRKHNKLVELKKKLVYSKVLDFYWLENT